MAYLLRLISSAFAAVSIGFGINAFYNPASALSFFELDYPATNSNRALVDALLAVYGVRDIFMGIALWAAAYYGTRRTLGVITMAQGAVAFADGAVCKWIVGHGEWNHWGYAPMGALVGLALMVI